MDDQSQMAIACLFMVAMSLAIVIGLTRWFLKWGWSVAVKTWHDLLDPEE